MASDLIKIKWRALGVYHTLLLINLIPRRTDTFRLGEMTGQFVSIVGACAIEIVPFEEQRVPAISQPRGETY